MNSVIYMQPKNVKNPNYKSVNSSSLVFCKIKEKEINKEKENKKVEGEVK